MLVTAFNICSKQRTRSPFSSSNSNKSLSNHSLNSYPDSVVLVEGNACSKTVVLNRPSSLNALNTSMANRLHKLYKRWEDRPDIGFVVMKGRGRGFCAGGDIVALHDTIKKENEAAKTHDSLCVSILKKLKYASPISLKVTLKSIREARFETLDRCLIREYRLTTQSMSCEISSDFCEWDPPRLENVSQDMVDCYFSSLRAFEHELELPVQQLATFYEQLQL